MATLHANLPVKNNHLEYNDSRLTDSQLHLATFNSLFLNKLARCKMNTQLKYTPQSAALRLINNFKYLCESIHPQSSLTTMLQMEVGCSELHFIVNNIVSAP